jgi:hypothetical protein
MKPTLDQEGVDNPVNKHADYSRGDHGNPEIRGGEEKRIDKLDRANNHCDHDQKSDKQPPAI